MTSHLRAPAALLVALCAVLTPYVAAQPDADPGAGRGSSVMPTAEDIRRTQADVQRRLDDIQRSRSAREAASAASTGHAPMPQQQVMPDLKELARSGSVDPARLAQQFGQQTMQREGMGEERSYRVLAFVSLSMPAASLTRLARDVKKVGGVVVLRGMRYGLDPGSWQKSVEALKPLAETGADVQINPGLFQLFQIRAVPVIVVSPEGVADKGCAQGQCPGGAFAAVSGDVTLDYALNTLVDRRDAVGRLARDLSDALQ